MMDPSIDERLSWIKDPEEIPAFRDQLARQGPVDRATENKIAMRAEVLRRQTSQP